MSGAVEPGKRAEHKSEVVPSRLGEIVKLMRMDVHAAGGHFVQKGLPQMGAAAVDQGDCGFPALAERISQPGCKLKAAGATTDYHDAMHGD